MSDTNGEIIVVGKPQKKQRKKRAKKNPFAPKKGKTGYLYFCAEMRSVVRKEHPEIEPKQVIHKLADIWSEWRGEQDPRLERYLTLAADDKLRYKTEKEEWLKVNPSIYETPEVVPEVSPVEVVPEVVPEVELKPVNTRMELVEPIKPAVHNAFHKFSLVKRPELKNLYIHLNAVEITSLVKDSWTQLSRRQRAGYKI